MRRARWIGISERQRVTRYKVWRMVFGKRRRPNLQRIYRSTLCLWPRGVKCVAFPALDRPPPAQGAIGMSMRAAPYERARSRALGSAERIHLLRHLRLMHREEHRLTIPKAGRHAMRRARWIGIKRTPTSHGDRKSTRRQVVGKTQRPNLLRGNPSTLWLWPRGTTCLVLRRASGPRTSLRWPVTESRDRLLRVDRRRMSLGLNTVRSR